MTPTSARHWLIWDGACDLCAWSIAWVRKHDRYAAFQAVPFQSLPPELQAQVDPDSFSRGAHVITADGRVLRAGRAVLFILEQLGYRWVARILSLPPFVWLVELGYAIVARNRRRLSRWLRLGETHCPR